MLQLSGDAIDLSLHGHIKEDNNVIKSGHVFNRLYYTELYDLIGRKVKSINESVSNLTSGIYIEMKYDNEGNYISQRKILVR